MKSNTALKLGVVATAGAMAVKDGFTIWKFFKWLFILSALALVGFLVFGFGLFGLIMILSPR